MHLFCDRRIMVVKFFLGRERKARGHNRKRIRTELFGALAEAYRIRGRDAARARIDRHSAAHFVDDGRKNLFALRKRERIGLAVCACRENAVHTAC